MGIGKTGTEFAAPEASRVFAKSRNGKLPIVDKDLNLISMISRSDLAKELAFSPAEQAASPVHSQAMKPLSRLGNIYGDRAKAPASGKTMMSVASTKIW
ncbi:Uu.00g139740.m01.CDS01 [Anthostomella pinea]|uniref:Uu.00g139740.m01.CDS01 n=1 Tax=Anthostomella pinea TaxID=933095 RepID=A0AAI8VPY7_9PEZI|nr:Uu.00g139740.m01.CDS01 [Anthostomella pinea]